MTDWEPGDPLHLHPHQRITGNEPGVYAVRHMIDLVAEHFTPAYYGDLWCPDCSVTWDANTEWNPEYDMEPDDLFCWVCGKQGEDPPYDWVDVA